MRRTAFVFGMALSTALFSAFALAQNVGIVTREGNHFVLNGAPFYYAGTNNYYQMVYAADPGLRQYVNEVQNEMAAMGMTVLRTWAFNDGAGQWNALQVAPGVYQEYVFQGLDYVLAKADSLGIRVILPFVNNWDDYGGMYQYADWADSVTAVGIGGFVQRSGTHFQVDGKNYFYAGASLWYGLNLASAGTGGDRSRLARELDSLRAMGVTNLRIMAGTEGPDTEPWRMVPSLQTSPGVYNSQVLDGLDYLIAEMKERGIRAVMCLNNFWQWSGGMAQYVNWNGGGPIPYPPPQQGGSWDDFQDYASDFYSNAGAKQDFRDHINFLVNRTNPYTGFAYRDEPAIFSWELANEPRGFNNNAANFNLWIDSTAAYIKSLDPNHLVTTGCEGNSPWPTWNGLDFTLNHNGPNIDYTTIHIWPQNWEWYDPTNPGGTYATAETNSRNYFNTHEATAVALGKPMVLEEFGLARDNGSFDPASATTYRNTFYNAMYSEVYTSASTGGPVAGDNFWAWGGEGRPLQPYGSYWAPGNPWIGDPPHEQQGWYSVYNTDASTMTVVDNISSQMRALIPDRTVDNFYTDLLCRQFYQNHIATVLNRVNTFNGRLYKQDPTVFAWELANEARCSSDPSGNTLQNWTQDMSAYIKSLDSLHMVTTGSEGFYGPTGPAHNPVSWMGSQGVDYTRNHQTATIDFCCCHAWPDSWGITYTAAMAWATNHINDTQTLIGKPVILEEYGKQEPIATRNQWFQGWLDAIWSGASSGSAAGGSNLWILYHDVYPNYDGFGVYYPAHASTISILEAHADSMNNLSGLTTSGYSFAPGWHMLSVPLIPLYSSVDSIFGDDIVGPYFVYDYSPLTGYSLVEEVAHGPAYWLALQNSTNVDLSGRVDADSTQINLSTGWNLVGCAPTMPVLRDSLHFSNGITNITFAQAVNSQWITPAVYRFVNTQGSYALVDTLTPWGGYWLQALVPGLQMITYPSGAGRFHRAQAQNPLDDENDWFVPILVTQGQLSDHLAGFGAHLNATNGYDPWYDLPAPPIPPSGEYVRLVYYRPEWLAPVGEVFCQDVRAPLDTAETVVWEGRIEASQNGLVTLDFENITQILPEGYWAMAECDSQVFSLLQTPSFSFDYTQPETIWITVSNELPAIQDLAITIVGRDAILDWGDVQGAQVYHVYRSSQPYFGVTGLLPIGNPTTSQYTDPNIVVNSPFFYRVTWE